MRLRPSKPPGGKLPPGGFFPGLFSGEIPYHRSILSSAVRCGKWSERQPEELLIPSARRPSASPAPPAGSRGWQNWYSGKMEESGFDEVQTEPLRQRAGADPGAGGPRPYGRGPLRAFGDSRLSGCAARRKAAPKAVFIKS